MKMSVAVPYMGVNALEVLQDLISLKGVENKSFEDIGAVLNKHVAARQFAIASC